MNRINSLLTGYPRVRAAGKWVAGKGERYLSIASAHLFLHKSLSDLPNEQVQSLRQLMQNTDVLRAVAKRPHSANIFLAGLSFEEVEHKLANLIQGIVDITGRLAASRNTNQEFINNQGKRIDQLNQLVVGLIGLYRIMKVSLLGSRSAMVYEKTDLHFILSNELEAFKLLYHTLNLSVENNGVTEKIKLDQYRFMVAIYTLLLNSQQAHAKQVRIIIEKIETDPSRIQIQIVDDGEGFDIGIKDKITTRGFTTKTRGHGFGTSSAKMIIEDHGGTFDIDSPGFGKGCTVTITLPIVSQ